MIDQYTELTGKAPVPPVWSLGVILSKAYYQDVPEQIPTAKAVREHNMPCDVITLDGPAWQYTDTRFAFEWDPKRFTNFPPSKVIATGKQQGRKVFTLQTILPMAEQGLAAGCASNVVGFSLHSGVISSVQDRGKLERLCRYITRSGVSEKRLAITTYPKVRYPLKTPYRDGNTGDRRSHTTFELLDFIARLAALVPKPRDNLTRLDEKHPCFSPYGQALLVQPVYLE
jgi:hypothetical protein